jgi:uncharacterized membrane protein YfcA
MAKLYSARVPTDFAPLTLVALFAVGLVSGALNVVAGGGSFLTVPVLLFAGLPGAEANATNRVGVLAQNLGGVWGFHRSGALPWRWALAASVPAMAGAALGATLALRLPDLAFRRLLAVAMLGMTLWTVRRTPAPAARATPILPSHPGMVAAFFVIGVYGGLIQAGIGFSILAATSVAGLDLVKGNAIKVLTVLLLTTLSLAIFAANGVVRWGPGLALGLGNVLGALVGVRLALRQGHRWIERVVTGAVVVFALLLLAGG